MSIKINNTDIRLRPSAIDGFYSCAYRWGKTFLEGCPSNTNTRAAIGTAIHRAAEVFWTDAIDTKKKDPNISKLSDASMESFSEAFKEGLVLDEKESEGEARAEILKGTEAFIEDIVPFSQIPLGVEEFVKIDIEHELVSELGGTIDYITANTIGDLKTSKRKIGPQGHVTQQSIYKYLAQENGKAIEHNIIQGVVLTKTPSGSIMTLEANVPQAKARVNGILDVLDLVLLDVAPIETILRPNPKDIFCSRKFCALYDNGCPATTDAIKSPTKVVL